MRKRLLVLVVLALGLAVPAAADTIDAVREATLLLTPQDSKVTTILLKEGQDLEQLSGARMWAAGRGRLMRNAAFAGPERAVDAVIKTPVSVATGEGWDVPRTDGQLVWRAESVDGRAHLKAPSSESGHVDHH